mmetsp:Transcript_15810/g.22962  ORF Transcript_15810/g.22962 Transcript_15810/m.22962 type:complete len:167 (-) Transcript_15810:76-576(-)
MEFPKSPPSNLMKRLEAFLPQIQKANHELSKNTDDSIQIDKQLNRDDDDGDDDDDDDPSEEGDHETMGGVKNNGETKKPPMIELSVELGDMEKNKEVFNLLSGNEEQVTSKTEEIQSIVMPGGKREPIIDGQKEYQNLATNERMEIFGIKDSSEKKESKVLIEELP